MSIRRILMVVAMCTTAMVILCSPSAAFIYDGGQPQHLGVQVKTGTSCSWVAEPFTVPYDAYATSIGAAAGRAMGPVDAGFEAWLYTIGWVSHVPDVAIAHTPLPIVPLNTQYVYYDQPLASPVFLSASAIYAVVLKPTDPSFTGSVSWGVVPGTYYGQGTGDDGKSWYKLSYPLAVRVDGYFVPEPCSLGVLLVGLVGMVTRRRTR